MSVRVIKYLIIIIRDTVGVLCGKHLIIFIIAIHNKSFKIAMIILMIMMHDKHVEIIMIMVDKVRLLHDKNLITVNLVAN